MGELLVKQIAHELKNYSLYRSFANYFSVEGILALEEYFNRRAAEEKLHEEWISNFLSEADVRYMYPAIEANTEKIVGSLDPFTFTVDREIETSQMIYSIYELAMTEKDYMTTTWLFDKLLKEQIEEENTSRMAKIIMEEDSDIFIKAARVLDLLKINKYELFNL